MIKNILIASVFAIIAYSVSNSFFSGWVGGVLYMAIAMEIDMYLEKNKR